MYFYSLHKYMSIRANIGILKFHVNIMICTLYCTYIYTRLHIHCTSIFDTCKSRYITLAKGWFQVKSESAHWDGYKSWIKNFFEYHPHIWMLYKMFCQHERHIISSFLYKNEYDNTYFLPLACIPLESSTQRNVLHASIFTPISMKVHVPLLHKIILCFSSSF